MWKKILLGIVAILVLVPIIAWFWLRSAHSPIYEGELSLKALSERVEVTYDEWGVPHIEAANELDAYKALGYVHAQDRIFQMDLMRRVGGGRLSALLGEDLVGVDSFFRILGVSAHAKSSTELFLKEGEGQAYLESAQAYLDGINAFIAVGKLPLEYRLLGAKPEPFTLLNIHEIVGYMSFTFAMALKTEPVATHILQKLDDAYLAHISIDALPDHFRMPVSEVSRTEEGRLLTDVHHILEQLPIPLLIGSNAWVLSPEKSQSGAVVFCNDTHIGFSQPAVWYEAHLNYPGYSFYGNHLAGVPFPLIGHSQTHSFGLTMFENDDFDLYRETLTADGKYVVYKDTVQAIESYMDTIHVKGGKSIPFRISSTPRGNLIQDIVPEIRELGSQPVSAWWVFLKEPSKALKAMYGMNRAQNIQEFEEAVALIHAPGLNVMYGDADGNIAWWAAAKLPIRPEGVSTKFIMDAASGEHEPLGWHPFTANPMSINPEEGFVYSANNMPDTTSAGLWVPGYYYPGDRGRAIHAFLSAKDQYTIDDMKELQLSHDNIRHASIAHCMADQIKANSEMEKAALDYLSSWQGGHSAEEVAPVIYHKLAYHTLHLKMADEIGTEWVDRFIKTFLAIRSVERLICDKDSPWWDDLGTDQKETSSDILQAAFAKTMEELQGQLGNKPDAWQWKKVISVEHGHALGAKKPLDKIFNVGPLYIDGNKEAVNKLDFAWNKDGIYKVTSGPAMRIVLDFANVESSESILPTGQSGNVFSPYYKNQANLYAEGTYRLQDMNIGRVRSSKHKLLVLTP